MGVTSELVKRHDQGNTSKKQEGPQRMALGTQETKNTKRGCCYWWLLINFTVVCLISEISNNYKEIRLNHKFEILWLTKIKINKLGKNLV